MLWFWALQPSSPCTFRGIHIMIYSIKNLLTQNCVRKCYFCEWFCCGNLLVAGAATMMMNHRTIAVSLSPSVRHKFTNSLLHNSLLIYSINYMNIKHKAHMRLSKWFFIAHVFFCLFCAATDITGIGDNTDYPDCATCAAGKLGGSGLNVRNILNHL